MPFDFNAIERLPPDAKVAALQKLEAELRMLITKRQDEIKQSQREITEAESLLERAKDELMVLEKIATPEAKGVRIDDLFFKPGRKREEKLEEQVEQAREEERRRQEDLAHVTQPRNFDALKTVYETQQKGLSEEQANAYASPTQPVNAPSTVYKQQQQQPQPERRRIQGEGYKRQDER